MVNGSEDVLPRHLRPFCGAHNFFIFSIFSQKNAKFPILAMQKTSMGNNVGSVEDRAVKFACSIGFSAIDTRRLSVCLFVCLFVCPLATSRKTADSSS